MTAPVLSALQPPAEHNLLANFDSGEPSLDDWPKRRAAKNQANGSSRTYVVCEGDTVVGCHCLATDAIGHAEVPSTMKRNRPDLVPVFVLGRLAIHKDHHQKGIGTALLNDAIRRAISEQARRFYLSRGSIESPFKHMTLCLMLATVDQALREPKHRRGWSLGAIEMSIYMSCYYA